LHAAEIKDPGRLFACPYIVHSRVKVVKGNPRITGGDVNN
jgi:hypothetical protein